MPDLSIIVPVYNAARTIDALLRSLCGQSRQRFELIVVDDGSSDGTPRIVRGYPCQLMVLANNRGPAHCRNLGASRARGDTLVFTDSDCLADGDWLEKIARRFEDRTTDALMGKVILPPAGYLGDAISALGFPAGGSIGFEKMWKVSAEGFTTSLSTCNCAVRKNVFHAVGGFDESFPYPGGEDTLFAHNLVKMGYNIKYCPEVIVYHEARESLDDFLRWQFKRGISSYIFARKIVGKGDFVSLRLWSTRNVIRHHLTDPKLPLIVGLLGVSLAVQLAGFAFARRRYRGRMFNKEKIIG